MYVPTRWIASRSILIIGSLVLGGCASKPYFRTHPPMNTPPLAAMPALTADNPRHAPMFTASPGMSGIRLDWPQLIDAIAWADVIIIGEQHDDAIGHAFQRAVVQDVTARWPGPSSALSMEMLEHDEQALADDYLEGIIDAKTFAKETFSESWAGEGSWANWYQPIIDAAKSHNARLIAANAPRRYVRLARTDGYERLRSLPEDRRELFDLPRATDDAAYRRRFFEVMTENDAAATQPASQPATPPTSQAASPAPTSQAAASSPQSQPGAGHGEGAPTAMQIEASYRSQSVWDATMAGSIADAHHNGVRKVVHLVGQFHCDFEGGTVAQLKARWPNVKLLVISMQREDAVSLRSEDRGRADVVVYTEKEKKDAHEEPSTTMPQK